MLYVFFGKDSFSLRERLEELRVRCADRRVSLERLHFALDQLVAVEPHADRHVRPRPFAHHLILVILLNYGFSISRSIHLLHQREMQLLGSMTHSFYKHNPV